MQHLNEVDESYLEHFSFAFSVGIIAIIAGLLSIVHALIPSFFTKSAGDAINYLSNVIEGRRKAMEKKPELLQESSP